MIPDPGRTTKSPFFFLSSILRHGVAIWGVDPSITTGTSSSIIAVGDPCSSLELNRLFASLWLLLVGVCY